MGEITKLWVQKRILCKKFLRHGQYAKMTRLFSPLFWYIDIKNLFKIEVSTASKLGTEKLEQCRMMAQSLRNHQTLSAKKNFVKKFLRHGQYSKMTRLFSPLLVQGAVQTWSDAGLILYSPGCCLLSAIVQSNLNWLGLTWTSLGKNMPKCPVCSPRHFGILISKICLKLRFLRHPRWRRKS